MKCLWRWDHLLVRKCPETVVGLDTLVCLSSGLRCSLKRFSNALFMVMTALYHVNKVF